MNITGMITRFQRGLEMQQLGRVIFPPVLGGFRPPSLPSVFVTANLMCPDRPALVHRQAADKTSAGDV